ncbi:PREDICTED: uncharacterized protein K02A2.6-like, partial [Rhagoletis zephyria]|uniref:uncharacterized protein K02A2.6-like n=1 Tax=Rhagoletis zephyria TaxID=28612 RepID=UPI0008113612
MAASRMQRWALILSGFNYRIEYAKGTLNNADGLSRMSQSTIGETDQDPSYISYVGFVNALQLDYKDVAKESRRDPVLSKVIDGVQNGTVSQLKSKEFEPFRLKALELTVESGCLLWGYRTVIPLKFQKTVLGILHESHLGIVKTNMLARSYIWWPNIDKDIEALVKECVSCQRTQENPEKSPLIPWIICRFGLFDTLVSDNGRQFTSSEFKNFTKKICITHIFTAPGHPATNGQAENFVKALKKSLYANLSSNDKIEFDTALHRFLFDYRISKHCTTNESSAKLLLGRELKSRFNLLKPPITKAIIEAKQHSMIANFRGKRNIKLSHGQKVY